MITTNYQGKDHKVAATQESTAQNSANQSKAFGLFTDQELTNIVNNSGSEFVKPSFLINYLHQAEKVLDRARMSDENRNFIKGAFAMLAAFGNWNTSGKEWYEYIVQNDDPGDVRQMLEDGDEAAAVDAIFYETGCILADLQNDEQYWFDEDEVEKAKEALEEYCSIVQEYKLQDLFEGEKWVFDEVDKVLYPWKR